MQESRLDIRMTNAFKPFTMLRWDANPMLEEDKTEFLLTGVMPIKSLKVLK